MVGLNLPGFRGGSTETMSSHFVPVPIPEGAPGARSAGSRRSARIMRPNRPRSARSRPSSGSAPRRWSRVGPLGGDRCLAAAGHPRPEESAGTRQLRAEARAMTIALFLLNSRMEAGYVCAARPPGSYRYRTSTDRRRVYEHTEAPRHCLNGINSRSTGAHKSTGLTARSGSEPQPLVDDHVRLYVVLYRPPPDPVEGDRAELDKPVEGSEMIRQSPARAAQPRVPVGRSE